MSPRRGVKSLRSISLTKFAIFVENLVFEKSFEIVNLDRNFQSRNKKIVDPNNPQFIAKYDLRSEAVDNYSRLLRDYIFEQVVYSLVDEVAKQILVGIKNGCTKRKESWRLEDDSDGRFAAEMMTIVDFTQMIVTPQLRQLDLSQVVKILRSRLFDLLPGFSGLFTLRCGSGSGGVSDIYRTKILTGVRSMRLLVHFSLQYDCNDSIIKVLVRNCKNSLRILDVEYSLGVSDNSVSEILQCTKIVQIHLFRTSMTSNGHADLLLGLKSLRILFRGDFLCEALQILSEKTQGEIPPLAIEEFWSSEDYFFHDNQQMALVASCCPRMRKIMFQFNPEYAQDFLILAPFQNLTELHNWGGDFYSDRLNELICLIGHRLKVLYLIHVDEIDSLSLGLISRTCKNVDTLGFYNCTFDETCGNQRIRRDTSSSSDRVCSLEPMLELKKLAIVSSCGTDFIVQLVGAALNVVYLIFGLSTDFSDACVKEILPKNNLAKLEELKVSKSSDLSITTVYNLIERCPNLKVIRDMEYWEGVSSQELHLFRQFLWNENYDVLTADDWYVTSDSTRGDMFRKTTGYWSRTLQALQSE